MVSFTKNSIIIKIDSDDPFEDWLQLIKGCETVTPFLLTNEDKHPNDYDLYWFGELKRALFNLDVSHGQGKAIRQILELT